MTSEKEAYVVRNKDGEVRAISLVDDATWKSAYLMLGNLGDGSTLERMSVAQARQAFVDTLAKKKQAQ